MKFRFLAVAVLLTTFSVALIPALAFADGNQTATVKEPDLPDYTQKPWEVWKEGKTFPLLYRSEVQFTVTLYAKVQDEKIVEQLAVFYTDAGEVNYAEWIALETGKDGKESVVLRGYTRENNTWKYQNKKILE